MKRICSILLSAALCLSLSAPAFAAKQPTSFTDAKDIQHWEAVATLTQLGIIEGKEDGAFHPTDTITRAECAKLITRIFRSGEEYVPWETAVTGFFPDISGHWAEKYIDFCGELHIINGRGDGSFDPDAAVTGLELLKMALTTLNYDAEEYHLVGDSWAESTDKQSRWTAPSLYTGLTSVNISQPITRDDAAQILYNALQVPPKCIVFYNDGRFPPSAIVDATREDGSLSSLLWEYFHLDETPEVPAQPE